MRNIEMPLIVNNATATEVDALKRLSTALDTVDSERAARALGISTTELNEVRSAMNKLDEAGVDFRNRMKAIREPREDNQRSLFDLPQMQAAVT